MEIVKENLVGRGVFKSGQKDFVGHFLEVRIGDGKEGTQMKLVVKLEVEW